MSQKTKTAITPIRTDDYPEWYQQVIRSSDMAENSPVRGCMVIKPWGWGIWENIQKQLDKKIKDTGHENAYFPLFVPISFLEKEATHVEGFAKECAVVTHHRLEEQDGKLIPTGKLEEPLIVRPTSETIIGDSFSRWVQSYRDLPLLINQWANVVRWEMRPRVFLRTSEFLWQEGHTAHATEVEAKEETSKMLDVYKDFLENVLAIPVISGEKSETERFPGAENTYTVEAMMQDRKALQAGTSHYLGQNFSKASNIRFLSEDGEHLFAYTTSWGVSTRLIGGLVMTHGDDDGLRLPPKVAPKQVVILPVAPKKEAEVFEYADKIKSELENSTYNGSNVSVHVDKRDLRGGEKSWSWVKKGAPVRIEVGPRDLENDKAVVYRRDKGPKEKEFVSRSEIPTLVPKLLDEIQNQLFVEALEYRNSNIQTGLKDFGELKEFFTPKNKDKPEIHGGFVKAKWDGSVESEKLLQDLKVTIRCLPLEQSKTEGKCIITGNEANQDAIFAKSY